VRDKRERPGLDDKVLVDWNGLMISALSLGARVFDNPDYLEAARGAAAFIFENMITPEGRLLHCQRSKKSSVEGFADDYAFFIRALLDLYEASFDSQYLEKAIELQRVMIEDFWDASTGGGAFFFTTEANKDVIVRQKNFYDGALPSANSIALLNLLKLSHMTDETEFNEKAARLASILTGLSSPSAQGFLQFLCSADFLLGPSCEIVVVGEAQAEDTREMLSKINTTFLPNKVTLFCKTEAENKLGEIAGFTLSMKAAQGRATAYVCKERACNKPTTDIEEMLALLKAR
jgi:uncharacterized protein YyaL (SSP411 family)